MNYEEQIQDSVIQNLSDGLVIVSFDGTIIFFNRMASVILGIDETQAAGRKFAEVFFDDSENDAFGQAVVDAVYSKEQPYSTVVTYYAGKTEKQLRMITSYIQNPDGKPVGIAIVISDLSELMELRDSVKAMGEIRRLNRNLNARNELLSKTFGQFLSDEIVNELLETPGGLAPGGRKRNVTMMMSDLRGFTAISEQMDAEDLIRMLNHYLEVMTDAIQGRGGTIIEFIGDGILAVFGVPKHSDMHAADAVAAALEMQAAMQDINQWNLERDYPPLEMGIGLDSGEVIVGNIGSEKRMKYGVVGSHVNLCGRVESYTTGGQILISPNVRELIQIPLEIDKEMTVFPKGAEEEMVLSHIVGIGAPYDIHIMMKTDVPKKLEKPVPIYYNRVEGKHTLEKTFYGGIIAIGHDCAELETLADLKLFENIRIEAGGHLFCKIIQKNDDTYLLQFTSIPSGYGEWHRTFTSYET